MDKISVQEAVLERVKVEYGVEDALDDLKIKNYISNAFDEYCHITGDIEVKETYLYVIEGVVKKRYVKSGDEGLVSANSDGYSVNYDSVDDFAQYYPRLSVDYRLRGVNKVAGQVFIY